MNTNDFKIGDRVTYRPDDPAIPAEFGVVTGTNERYVFVLFDRLHISEYGKACHPHDLKLMERPSRDTA
jgi:hypothetical protein